MIIVLKKLLLISLITLSLYSIGCAPKTSMQVLIKMMDSQEVYFKDKVVLGFGEKEKVDLEVVHYNNTDSIINELEKYSQKAGLIKIPFEKSKELIAKGVVKPLEDFLIEEDVKAFDETYMLTSLASSDGKHYLIPRKFETRLMVYRKSKVKEVIALWRKHKNDISEQLKMFNGFGLPANFIMEDDPNKWDYYDVYAAGWIWAHSLYNGKMGPKIAHRGKRYSGTSHRVIDRIFQCGGDSSNVITMTGDPVIDAFHWEAVYASGKIYNEKMWKDNWSGSGVWKGFKEGEVFLSFMTQLDCFFIHGTGQDGLDGFLDDPDDMGVAVMPEGCSVELDKNGMPIRKGRRAITTGGWWWGIPSNTPDPVKSYALAKHITSLENQVQGCSRFGMIPVRKDVLSDMNMLFGGDWISMIYNVSFQQLMLNKFTLVPTHSNYGKIAETYLDAWFDIVVSGNWSGNNGVPDPAYIRSLIKDKYKIKIDSLL